jgi:hypothetical protein
MFSTTVHVYLSSASPTTSRPLEEQCFLGGTASELCLAVAKAYEICNRPAFAQLWAVLSDCFTSSTQQDVESDVDASRKPTKIRRQSRLATDFVRDLFVLISFSMGATFGWLDCDMSG